MIYNTKPFFSVIIPTYNRAHLIEKAINSVLNQTFHDFELIIADDCSTDNTKNVIAKIGNPKIKFIQNDINKGNAGARNLGAREARGYYICYLDSDDKFHENFLEKTFSLIEDNNSPGFLWCQVNKFDDKGQFIPRIIPEWHPMEQQDPYIYFLNGLFLGTNHGFTVRNDCFQKTGYFDEDLRVSVDTDFILRLVRDYNFAFTKDILIDTYDHEGDRVRRDSFQKLKSYQILIKKHEETILKYEKLKRRWFYKLMWLSYHNNEKSEARKYLMKCIKIPYYKAIPAAILFELLPNQTAVKLHKKISH